MGTKVEAWTLPDSASFERKVGALEFNSLRVETLLNEYGTGAITVDANYSRLKEIIDGQNNVTSLIRVFEDGVNTESFFASQANRKAGQQGTIPISGLTIRSAIEWGTVFPRNFVSGEQNRFPDWIWGGVNILTDPSFEASDQTTEKYQLIIRAAEGDFRLGVGFFDTDPMAHSVNAQNIEIRLQDDVAEINDVVVTGQGTQSSPFVIEFINPSVLSSDLFLSPNFSGVTWKLEHNSTGGDLVLNVNGNNTAAIPYNVSASGMKAAIEAVSGITTVEVVSEVDSDNNRIYYISSVNPTSLTLYVSSNNLTGGWIFNLDSNGHQYELTKVQDGTSFDNLNVEPLYWTRNQFADQQAGDPRLHGGYAENGFRLSNSTARTGETSLYVNGTKRFSGLQQIRNVEPGGIYQAGIWVWSTDAPGADTYRLVIRDLYENLIAQVEYQVTATATWEYVSLPDVVIPDNVEQVVFRFASVGKDNPWPFFVDDAEFTEGFAPATFGEIVTVLMNTITSRGTLNWLKYDGFTDLLDSHGNPWASTESITVPARMNMGQVMSEFASMGYEWNILWNDVEDTYELVLYDKFSMGTTVSGWEVKGGKILSSEVEESDAKATSWLIEGDDSYFLQHDDATLVSAFGRRESGIGVFGIGHESLQSVGETQATLISQRRWATTAILDSTFRPMTVASLGDLVQVHIPDVLTPLQLRIYGIVTLITQEGVTYRLDLGRRRYREEVGGTTSSATSAAVNYLLREFKRRRLRGEGGAPGIGGGAGGEVTVVVAAFDASDISKNKADFLATGTNDGEVIMQAAQAIRDSDAAGGRIKLSEGNFQIDVGLQTIDLDGFGTIMIEGVGAATKLVEVGTPSGGTSNLAIIRSCDYLVVKHLTIFGSSSDYLNLVHGIKVEPCSTGETNSLIDHVEIYNMSGYGIWVEDDAAHIRDSYLVGCGDGAAVQGNLYVQDCGNVTVDGVVSSSATGSGFVVGNNARSVKFTGCTADTCDKDGFYILGDACVIVGCEASFNDGNGFVLVGDRNLLASCRAAENSRGGDDLFDGIEVWGDENVVQGCAVRHGGGGTQHKWGVSVIAGATDNIVVGNDLRDSGKTADYSDAGTGTVNTYPGGAAGDNFV